MIVVALQFSNTLDTEALREGGHVRVEWPFSSGIRINLVVSIVAIVLIVLVPVVVAAARRLRPTTAVIGEATLGFTVLVTLWCAFVVPLLPSDFVLGAALEHLTLAVAAIAAVVYSWAAWLTR